MDKKNHPVEPDAAPSFVAVRYAAMACTRRHTLARGLALLMLALPCAAAGAPPPATTPVASVDPAVPTPAGRPCVVSLFHNRQIVVSFETIDYTYAPPPGCPGPWAKVVLRMDFAGSRDNYAATTTLRLAGVPLFQGAMPDFDTTTTWHAQRDVTDQASLFVRPHNGRLSGREVEWNAERQPLVASARLLFYRATAAAPAPSRPDAVYGLGSDASTALRLPHNIVRAYLDVYNAAPWWFTCVPDADLARRWQLDSSLAPGDERKLGIFPPSQGCGGGSFAEIRVSIDGIPAGVAPYFPRLAPDANYLFTSVLDRPAPALQMLDITPYRVDLTPFAAILNEAGPHRIALDGLDPVDAQLLVYLDKDRARVGGAVTLNTLAGNPARPRVRDTLAAARNALDGRIDTRHDRSFKIRGYVDTSRGRLVTTVTQGSHFRNTQDFHLVGLDNARFYRQHLRLLSTVDRHSRTLRGDTLLREERHHASYPLTWQYDMAGDVIVEDGVESIPRKGTLSVDQARNEDTTQARAGMSYTSHLRDSFAGVHTRNIAKGRDLQWNTLIQRSFRDDQGSCRLATLGTEGGTVAARTHGEGCPGNANRVRWFAHPDGSARSW